MRPEVKKVIEFATTEVMLWSFALIVLFFFGGGSKSFTLCFFHLMDLNSCWGCGLGHAIHDAMHLRLSASLEHHPLGIPVLLILLQRIFKLTRSRIKQPTTWISNN